MAYRRIYTRLIKTSPTDYPAAIKAEADRLIAAGTLTRTAVPVTDPTEIIAQNIGANQNKSVITELWTNQSAYNSYAAWCDSNHPGAHDAWKATNNCTSTIISETEI